MKSIKYLLIIVSLLISINLVIKRNKLYLEEDKIENTLARVITNTSVSNSYDYLLVIPQINLRKGIYSKDNIHNNISENVTIHSESDYPDSINSNLILMAHSGTGSKAFFKDIYKLNRDSLIEFYYNGVKYVYKIDSYYEVLKTGNVTFERDSSRKTITLITCSQSDKNKQLIYIGYLIDEIYY